MSCRGKKRAYAPMLAALLLCVLYILFCSCSIKREDSERVRAAMRDLPVIDDESAAAPIRYPLTLTSKHMEENGCPVNYPYICDSGMSLLNMNVNKAFVEFAEECEPNGGSIDYDIEFNRYGLLSVNMIYMSDAGELMYNSLADFDCDTGKRVRLSDCFGTGSHPFEKLSEMVEKYMEANNLTLIANLPEIDDTTMFSFRSGGIDLMFREYELCTYDAGAVSIRIHASSVSSLISSDGLLNRLSE